MTPRSLNDSNLSIISLVSSVFITAECYLENSIPHGMFDLTNAKLDQGLDEFLTGYTEKLDFNEVELTDNEALIKENNDLIRNIKSSIPPEEENVNNFSNKNFENIDLEHLKLKTSKEVEVQFHKNLSDFCYSLGTCEYCSGYSNCSWCSTMQTCYDKNTRSK